MLTLLLPCGVCRTKLLDCKVLPELLIDKMTGQHLMGVSCDKFVLVAMLRKHKIGYVVKTYCAHASSFTEMW